MAEKTESEKLREKIQEELRDMRVLRDENLSLSHHSEGPNTNNEETDNNPPTSDGQEAQEQTSRPVRVPDGISRAYNDIDVGDLDNPNKEKVTTNTSGSSNGLSAPSRSKDKSGGGGGKDIMEVFWNSYIIALYEWALNTATDTVIDFAEWWLFLANDGTGAVVETKTEKDNKKDVYTLGEEVFKSKMDKPIKNKELFDKAYNEIKENLARDEAGASPVWTIWDNEPQFYNRLRQINATARANPNSAEAKVIERFNKTPEIMQGILKKEEIVLKTAIRIATLEEAIDKNKPNMPETFNESFTELKKILANKSLTKQQIKDGVLEKIAIMDATLEKDISAHKDIKTKLDEIRDAVANDRGSKPSKFRKDITEKTKEINKIANSIIGDQDLIKKRIEQRGGEYYTSIMKNLDKIQEKYPDDTEKMSNATKEYLLNITQNIKPTKESIDAAHKSGVFNSKQKNKKAEESVKKIKETIDTFVLEGQNISSIPEAQECSEFPLKGNKINILQAVRDYSIGA